MPNSTAASFSESLAFRRSDESADERFYDFPRFVTHIDDAAINVVTEIYREFFPPGGAILDLMSSYVSHLPDDVNYSRVAGLGMNADELAANPRLTTRVVQNLNAEPILPFANDEFDAAAIGVSVQYLIEPFTVFGEIGRVLKENAPLVVTFSNRCFPTKAVRVWNAGDDVEHIELVRYYFAASDRFTAIEIRRHTPRGGDPLFALIGSAKK
ncbi:MAG: methyltransferase domain-containing protein [Pyrinomonadaceae bacterium]|nr:methyltransferase domain-containing protein [Pyrinomonadaceae bacterium]